LLSIATSTWYESDDEYDMNIQPGFGASIAIRYPGLCGKGNADATFMELQYFSFLDAFNMTVDEDDVNDCSETEMLPDGYPNNFFVE